MSATFHLRSPGDTISLELPVRALAVLGLLLALLFGIGAVSLMLGSYPLDLGGVWATLTGAAPSDAAVTVVWEFRFPRMLASALVGVLLGLSGAILQNVTLNPLADPSLVGVSQGASLAVVALVIAFPGADGALRPLYAFGGALVVAALIQWIAMSRRGGATMRFILTGIGVAAFISAITSALLTYGDIDQATAALGWLAGSIHAAGWDEVRMLSLCTLVLAVPVALASRPLSALRMGTEVAAGHGVRVRLARVGLITTSVALAAFAVAAVGPLGFVGLVAPHIARRLARSGVGLHLALTAATGALMVCAADLIGRTILAPVQIPAGIVTALLGVPVFVVLIVRGQGRSQL